MKKPILYIFLSIFALSLITMGTSCKTKEGCNLEEKYAAPVDKDGNLSTKSGKSGLWSKKQKKRAGG